MGCFDSMENRFEILVGDSRELLKGLPKNSVDCCITSPPYFNLRDYNNNKQIGREKEVSAYIKELLKVFTEVKRCLKDSGTLWVNLSDTYKKDGNLYGVPWKTAFAIQDDGWILRQCIIWKKPDPMPESVKNRFTKSHEYIFLFAKSKGYYFDMESVLEEAKEKATFHKEIKFGGNKYNNSYLKDGIFSKRENYFSTGKRHRRDVWEIPHGGTNAEHYAVFPEKLVEPMVLAGCPVDGVVLDPFSGTGTTGVVALKNNRNYIGCEVNPEYAGYSVDRIKQEKEKIPHANENGMIVSRNNDGSVQYNLF